MISRRDFVSAGIVAGVGAAVTTHARAVAASRVRGSQAFKLDYAPHFGMFEQHAADPLDQVRFAADNGFTAWEDNGMRGRSAEFQSAFAKVCEERGVRMGVFVAHGIEWSRPSLTTGDAGARDKFVGEIRESVELAKRINARWCTVVPGTVENRLPHGTQTANLIEALKRAAEVCEPSGLIMCIEPLNWRDHPGLFVRYSDHAYAIMKAVGSPCCKILFDAYHQQATEGNLIENIGRCWDEIAYFQVGDNPGRREPGTGEINYRNVFKFIHSRGFEGIVGMEHGNSRGGTEGELAVIQAYREADDFVV